MAPTAVAVRSPGPSPVSSRPTLIVLEEVAADQSARSLTLYSVDGKKVASLPTPTGAQALGARGDRIFVEEGQQLKAIHGDGTIEDLGPWPFDVNQARFAVAPDGKSWLWGSRTLGKDSTTIDGHVYLGSVTSPMREVAHQTTPDLPPVPYEWSARGPVIGHEFGGPGGAETPFETLSRPPYELLDLTTLALSPLPDLACNTATSTALAKTCGSFDQPVASGARPGEGGVTLTSDSGAKTNLVVPSTDQLGNLVFSPDGGHFTLESWNGRYDMNGRAVYRSPFGGPIVQVGPSGCDLAAGQASWLAGDSLLESCLDGFHIIGATGDGPVISTSGTLVGILGGP
ncbi:MAG TPA: hypothetical protein VG015_05440 [Candidatus Dormibacteraeota bacterium]|nr:hypothetical protein [Candidatus Dormibacteraeota bacterium]